MNILIRADASVDIGSGHVMRCKTLADELYRRGAEIRFVSRNHPGNIVTLLRSAGYPVTVLPAPQPPGAAQRAHAQDYALWLGVTQLDDAAQTIEALNDFEPDWLVVDHYALDETWESLLRPHVKRIFAIDDLANRPHDCDLLLDQNMVAQMHTRYRDKVPAACGLLLGPEYALLQPIYAELHDRIPLREGPIRRIFISFGGADSDNLTGRSLSAFLSLNRPDIEVDVVITTSGPYAETIRRQVAGHGNIHLHSDLPTLAPLMAAADLAIGAGGATSWERLCLGLPSLVITLAENQKPVAHELHRLNLVCLLGHKDKVNEAGIEKVLRNLTNKNLDSVLSKCCKDMLDGEGVSRIIELMFNPFPAQRTEN